METMTAQPIEQAAIDAGTDIPEIVAPAARRKLGALRSLGPFLKRYRWRLLIALVMLLVSSGAFLSVPLAFRGLIDHGFVAGSQMQGHFLLLFGIAVAWGCASAGRFYQVSWIGERITADLRSAIYRRMLAQDRKSTRLNSSH